VEERRKLVRLIATALLALLGIVVVLQNTETVETHVLFFSFSAPRAALLAATLALGFLVGLLIGSRPKVAEAVAGRRRAAAEIEGARPESAAGGAGKEDPGSGAPPA